MGYPPAQDGSKEVKVYNQKSQKWEGSDKRNEITFAIEFPYHHEGPILCTGLERMTWEEWINSSYCPSEMSFRIVYHTDYDAEGNVEKVYPIGKIQYNDYYFGWDESAMIPVNSNETIYPNQLYGYTK